MRLKIIHSPCDDNNLRCNTRVVDADTGEMVENIISIDLHIGVDGVWGNLRVAGPELDIHDLKVSVEENTE